MQELITSFAAYTAAVGKYGLSRSEVMAEIESIFSSLLSQWYRLQVMVFFREDLRLEAVAYDDSGGVIRQKPLDLSVIKGRKTILRHLEENLVKAAALKETARYKRFEKLLRWGEVTGRDQEGNFLVQTEVVPGESVLAVCPLNRIGVHERNLPEFAVGQRRAFHLRLVEPVLLNGTPRLKVVLDRVSKTLVENLLKEHLGLPADRIKIRCLKRYVGHKSLVLTTARLPKAAIIAVDRELKERVQVKIVKDIWTE